jgi:phage-related protein
MSDMTYSLKVTKPLRWLSGEVKTPPMSNEARREMGFLLRMLQEGESLSLPQSRPLPIIGHGCHELRVRDENKAWRLFYYIDSEAIVILEVGEKRTPQISKETTNICRRRLSDYELHKKQNKETVEGKKSASNGENKR